MSLSTPMRTTSSDICRLRRRRPQQAGAQRAAGSARLGQAASHQAFPHIRLLVSGCFSDTGGKPTGKARPAYARLRKTGLQRREAGFVPGTGTPPCSVRLDAGHLDCLA
jgi:hypothetical protein